MPSSMSGLHKKDSKIPYHLFFIIVDKSPTMLLFTGLSLSGSFEQRVSQTNFFF